MHIPDLGYIIPHWNGFNNTFSLLIQINMPVISLGPTFDLYAAAEVLYAAQWQIIVINGNNWNDRANNNNK